MPHPAHELDTARQAFEADPGHLGKCLRALRMLLAAADNDRARAVADRFAAAVHAQGEGAAALISFARQAPVRGIPRGARFITEGAQEDTVFLLLRGDAVVRREGVGEIGRLNPGRFCGEVSALLGTYRTASVEASDELLVMAMPAISLKKLAKYVPQVSRWLAVTARDRLLPHLMVRSILSSLSRDEQLEFFRQSRPMSFPESTVLVSSGQEVRAVGLIVSGRVSVSRRDLQGRRLSQVLGPGQLVAGADAVCGDYAQTSVVTVSPLTWCAVRVDVFRHLLQAHPGIAARLRESLPEQISRGDAEEVLARGTAGRELEDDGAVSTEMSLEQRAAFTTIHGGQACKACGFPDADVICPVCGQPQ